MNPLKKFTTGLAALACVVVALCAWAGTGYVTKSDPGTAASPAEVVFLSSPSEQIRIVDISYGSDTNNSQLSFSTGTTAFYQTATNTGTTAVTNRINSTNGLSASCVLILEHAGTAYVATVSSWNQATNAAPAIGQGTNVVLASGGWGVIPSPGDAIYLMSSATTRKATLTNAVSGVALYSGNRGRPVRVVLTPALATNYLDGVTAYYE